MNGRVFLINHVGQGINDQERVMCFDADTGRVLWQYAFNVFHTDIVSVRLGWTNLAGDPQTGNVYAQGTQGLFFCFDRDGKIVWSHSLTEEYGRISGYGGRVTSPAVVGDLVVIGMLNASWGDQARGANRFLAMDKRTGAVAWWASTGKIPLDTYYSVPVAATINGEALVISGSGDGGVYAFQARTGRIVWGYTFGAGAVNCSPVVSGSRVYIGHGEENLDTNKQGRIICLDGADVHQGKPRLIWERTGIKVKFSSPILHENRLYVCDENALLYCLDADTGKVLWKHKYGRNAKGSPVWADGKIYVADVNARFHILKPTTKGCEELHSQFFPSPDRTSDVEINGSPAIANGRVYFMTRDDLFCIGKKNAQATAGNSSTQASTEAQSSTGPPAQLSVFPADVAIYPGQTVNFSARIFDAKGNALGTTDVAWAVAPASPPTPAPPGPAPKPPPLAGKIDGHGKLTVAEKIPGQFGAVTVSANGLTGTARVRVMPRLPYKQTSKKSRRIASRVAGSMHKANSQSGQRTDPTSW
jgi:outer membrane protein assembly factor BamB